MSSDQSTPQPAPKATVVALKAGCSRSEDQPPPAVAITSVEQLNHFAAALAAFDKKTTNKSTAMTPATATQDQQDSAFPAVKVSSLAAFGKAVAMKKNDGEQWTSPANTEAQLATVQDFDQRVGKKSKLPPK